MRPLALFLLLLASGCSLRLDALGASGEEPAGIPAPELAAGLPLPRLEVRAVEQEAAEACAGDLAVELLAFELRAVGGDVAVEALSVAADELAGDPLELWLEAEQVGWGATAPWLEDLPGHALVLSAGLVAPELVPLRVAALANAPPVWAAAELRLSGVAASAPVVGALPAGEPATFGVGCGD